ncbi:autotransporter outer membrane beta-barrel domain-containing protein [Bartonella sp. B10]
MVNVFKRRTHLCVVTTGVFLFLQGMGVCSGANSVSIVGAQDVDRPAVGNDLNINLMHDVDAKKPSNFLKNRNVQQISPEVILKRSQLKIENADRCNVEKGRGYFCNEVGEHKITHRVITVTDPRDHAIHVQGSEPVMVGDDSFAYPVYVLAKDVTVVGPSFVNMGIGKGEQFDDSVSAVLVEGSANVYFGDISSTNSARGVNSAQGANPVREKKTYTSFISHFSTGLEVRNGGEIDMIDGEISTLSRGVIVDSDSNSSVSLKNVKVDVRGQDSVIGLENHGGKLAMKSGILSFMQGVGILAEKKGQVQLEKVSIFGKGVGDSVVRGSQGSLGSVQGFKEAAFWLNGGSISFSNGVIDLVNTHGVLFNDDDTVFDNLRPVAVSTNSRDDREFLSSSVINQVGIDRSTVLVQGEGAHGIYFDGSRSDFYNMVAERVVEARSLDKVADRSQVVAERSFRVSSKKSVSKKSIVLDTTDFHVPNGVAVYADGSGGEVSLKRKATLVGDSLLVAKGESKVSLFVDDSAIVGGAFVEKGSSARFSLSKGSQWFLTKSGYGYKQDTGLNCSGLCISSMSLDNSGIKFSGSSSNAAGYQTLRIGNGKGEVYTAKGDAWIRFNVSNETPSRGGSSNSQMNDRLLIYGGVSGTTLVDVQDSTSVLSSALFFVPRVERSKNPVQSISLIQVHGKAAGDSFKLNGDYVTLGGAPYQYVLRAYGPSIPPRQEFFDTKLMQLSNSFWDFRLESKSIVPDVKTHISVAKAKALPERSFPKNLSPIVRTSLKRADHHASGNFGGTVLARSGGGRNGDNYVSGAFPPVPTSAPVDINIVSVSSEPVTSSSVSAGRVSRDPSSRKLSRSSVQSAPSASENSSITVNGVTLTPTGKTGPNGNNGYLEYIPQDLTKYGDRPTRYYKRDDGTWIRYTILSNGDVQVDSQAKPGVIAEPFSKESIPDDFITGYVSSDETYNLSKVPLQGGGIRFTYHAKSKIAKAITAEFTGSGSASNGAVVSSDSSEGSSTSSTSTSSTSTSSSEESSTSVARVLPSAPRNSSDAAKTDAVEVSRNFRPIPRILSAASERSPAVASVTRPSASGTSSKCEVNGERKAYVSYQCYDGQSRTIENQTLQVNADNEYPLHVMGKGSKITTKNTTIIGKAPNNKGSADLNQSQFVSAVLADETAEIVLEQKSKIKSSLIGLEAQTHGKIQMDDGEISANYIGVLAGSGGKVYLGNTKVLANGPLATAGLAGNGGMISMDSGSIISTNGVGVRSESGGHIKLNNVSITAKKTQSKPDSEDMPKRAAFLVGNNGFIDFAAGNVVTDGTGLWMKNLGDAVEVGASRSRRHAEVRPSVKGDHRHAHIESSSVTVEGNKSYGIHFDGSKWGEIRAQDESKIQEPIEVRSLNVPAGGASSIEKKIVAKRSVDLPIKQSSEAQLKQKSANTTWVVSLKKTDFEVKSGTAIYGQNAHGRISLEDKTVLSGDLLLRSENGSDILVLADNSTILGGAHVDKSSHARFELSNESQWFLNKGAHKNQQVLSSDCIDSCVSSVSLANNSSIAFLPVTSGKSGYQTLQIGKGAGRIEDVYKSDGSAVIYLNARLNPNDTSDAQATDRLIIHGNVSGKTVVDVQASAGNTGKDNSSYKKAHNVSIIQVYGTAEQDSFKLRGDYVALAGVPYKYVLRSYSPDATVAEEHAKQKFMKEGGNFWNFRLEGEYIGSADSASSTYTVPGRTPSVPSEDADSVSPEQTVKAVVPQVPTYLLLPNTLFHAGLMDISNQNKQLETMRTASGGMLEVRENPALFLRGYGGSYSYTSNLSALEYGYGGDFDYNGMKAGLLLKTIENTDSAISFGVMGSYGKISLKPLDVEQSQESEFDKWSVTAYGSMQHDVGFYVDGLLSYGLFKGDVLTLARGKTATLKGNPLSASLTGGQSFAAGYEGLVFDPQVQVVYQHLQFDKVSDVDNFDIEMGNLDQWVVRVGGRLTKTHTQLEGARDVSFYGKLNLVHDFGKKQTVHFKDAFQLGSFGSSLEAGLGVNMKLSSKFTLHGDFIYQHKLSKAGFSGTTVSGGLRYQF